MLINLIKPTFTVFLGLTVLTWPMFAEARDSLPIVASSGPTAANLAAGADQLSVASAPTQQLRQANFLDANPSEDARQVADWVAASGDNNGLPFIVVDKIGAMVFVFDSNDRLLGATSALLGEARGDDSVPGIGSQKLATITPAERTTPAGRFVAEPGRDLEHNDILWIDYGASLALHRVAQGSPGDHRLQRLASTSPSDKRITYGCVNVSIEFYDDVVQKTFSGTTGIVYILPEIKTLQEVFPKVSDFLQEC